jgi:DNA-binding XRE family transcriptional regulator
MKVSPMTPFNEVLARGLRNPAARAEWERMAVARAVANRVVGYRAEHGLSQMQLAKTLGMTQSAIARLELGQEEPSLLPCRGSGGMAHVCCSRSHARGGPRC